MKNQFLLSFFLLFFTLNLFAQTGDVRGFVYDKDSGEPLVGANVLLQGTKMGLSTDIEGFYSLSRVPVGSYTMLVTFIGYDTSRVAISVGAGQILNQKIYLKEQSKQLNVVEISAEKEQAKTEVRTSTVTLTAKQINRLPSVGGEPDIAQYLQVLPGIVSTGDQGGQLYIRGGSMIQTKVLLDGMTVYNPFHSVGLFSVFETDVIRNVDVMTGGFGAEYGGRISAVIDIATREGNKKRIAGKVAANTFLSKAILEGPIVKLKETGGFSGSYLLTAKTSYLDKTSPKLYGYVDSLGLPYSFTDFYGKINFTSDNGSKLNLSAYRNVDRAKFQQTSEYNWNAWGGGGKFVIVPGQSKFIIDGGFSFSDYSIELREGDGRPRTSEINGFNGNMNFSYYFPTSEIKYGIELGGFATKFKFYNDLGFAVTDNQNTTEIAAYFKYKGMWLDKKLLFEPSIRLSYFASLPAFQPEPRLGIKYNVTDHFRLKASGGIYAQNFISTKSDRDVVNLFTGFLSAPEGQIRNTKDDIIRNPLQLATQAILGFEVEPARRFKINVEGYLNNFTQLVNLNRQKVFSTDPDWIVETGKATGVDILTQYDSKHLSVWLGYSLAFNTRYDGTIDYNPHFDRRHNVNFLTTYSFGNALSWELSLRWNLGSGFPFTKTQGFFEQLSFTGGIDGDYLTDNGQLGVVYSDKYNGGRLPYYHRLDLSVKKTIPLGINTSIDVNASVTNAYNRENIFYFDRIRYQRINQLPIIPSLGISFSF